MTEDELEDIERTVNACDGLTEGECRALIAEVRRLRDVENLYRRLLQRHEAERAARIGHVGGLSTDRLASMAGHSVVAIEDEQGATSNIVATWDESQIKPPKSKPPEPR